MVLSAKIFRLRKNLDFDLIADKLKIYKEEHEENDKILTSNFGDFLFMGDELRCKYYMDKLINIKYRGKEYNIPITKESKLIFKRYKDTVFLIILEKKNFANYIANKVSEALFIKIGEVVEVYIDHEILKALHESNPGAAKVIFFDNVDIPNVKKLSLYGKGLSDTNLYSMYLEHGKIWYVVFEFNKYGYIIGITRNCVLAMFTNIDEEQFIQFIYKEILPLL